MDDPLYLDATAGDAFSYTFRAQGSPAPTYQLDWYYGDEEADADSIVASKSQADSIAIGYGFDEGDDDYTVDDQLPDGITFDPATGELSGTATLASYYDFAVTATSGDVSTTQYVELTVDPAAAFGITAFTMDEKSITARDKRIWLIQPDGTISTVDLTTDEDGFPEELSLTPTGRPTVDQGGTLVVSGSPVDRFGNDTSTYDDDGNPTFIPTVTSDVASDVVAPYEENGAEGQGVFGVTFPHASVHTLTVSSGALQPVSFAVDVRPTTPTVAVVKPVATTGQLAYTGSDATGALPWALGLVLAGVGLIGARTLRRRHAQR
nr:putative Ig domain-containing protein [Curtobacterium pusillum]